ncbi:long-chain-fatty-acid--CoA ligase [Iamia sp. SCSIO 61187]|uniref:long-chain-fatty-acid--CoA ligase n=1 Tax=Iamia sp. SCSIO 61187 TaxID=2722752 RepID=UPI001C6373AD|nr:long-chain-fatty-acid--CoA ligase [Iamia sp. SCSIO 61187]QYG95151.1 long-chain-fatty-acid--CoA ligase [Iamia sp. SCSIO 61187]
MAPAEIASLADIVRVHGAQVPDKPALEVGERSVTFGELDARSSQAAQAFLAAGVGFGDRVAFIEKNSAEFFEVTFGLAKIGAVCVAVNWRLAPPEMQQIIEDAQAEVVIVGPDFFGAVEAIEDQLARVQTVVAIGGHDRWPSFEDWISSHPAEDPAVETSGDDVAFQLYTSGTTGLPKGVMLKNDNFFGAISGTADMWRFTPDSVNLAMMPTFHIAGAGWGMVGLYFGCTNVVMRDIDPAAILEAIPEHGITNAFMVPVVIQFLLITPGVEETDFSSLRAIVYGASPITDDVLIKGIERFGCEFIQVYGLTETTGAITQLDGVDHDPENRPELLRSCGKPYPWVELRVVDGKGNDVKTGEVGELWTRSGQNMVGYWNNPEATAEAVTPDGWFKTGDAGYLDEDGFVYLHDRVKDMIVSGGENVYPAEVENALMTHPDVADVAVIGVPDDRWGEAVKAIVVPAADAEPSEDDLIAHTRERLAGFKLPKSVDFATELPRNPSGKLLKRELREPYWEGVDRRVG